VKALHPTHPALWKAIDGRIRRWAQATLAPAVLDCHSAFAPSLSRPPHSLRNSRSHQTAWPPSPASDKQRRLRKWRWWRREEVRCFTIFAPRFPQPTHTWTLSYTNTHTSSDSWGSIYWDCYKNRHGFKRLFLQHKELQCKKEKSRISRPQQVQKPTWSTWILVTWTLVWLISRFLITGIGK